MVLPRKKTGLLAAVLGAMSVMADVAIFSDVTLFDKAASIAGDFPHQTFRSSPIHAPMFQVNKWEKDQVDDAGYIFIGTVYGKGRAGPMIIDASDLSLVYADQKYKNTYSSDVTTIDGEKLFGFWHGYHTRGHANGWCLIYDENYNLRYNVSAQGLHGALADMHETKMTQDKTVIFTTYFNIMADCSPVGGPKKALLQDSGFQEVDMETNEVLFDWAATDFFTLEDSYAKYTKPYGVRPDSGFDFFHINSVDKTADGNYLVSARHASIVTLIDGKDGHPIWILGGKRNQFTDLSNGTATNFAWQHDARFYNRTHLTMFDNHSEKTNFCDESEPCKTRGLHLEIDEEKMTVRVVQEYRHPERINSGAMGGLQHLDNGNVMMGWGYNPSFVEYKPDGTVVFDVQRGRLARNVPDMFAYRVHKGDWRGLPHWPPAIAADTPNNSSANGTVYLSWNGATEVKEWYVSASDDFKSLSGGKNVIIKAPRRGFETKITLPKDIKRRYVAAAAVNIEGVLLGSTVVLDMENGQPFYTTSDITSLDGVADNVPIDLGEPEKPKPSASVKADPKEPEKSKPSVSAAADPKESEKPRPSASAVADPKEPEKKPEHSGEIQWGVPVAGEEPTTKEETAHQTTVIPESSIAVVVVETSAPVSELPAAISKASTAVAEVSTAVAEASAMVTKAPTAVAESSAVVTEAPTVVAEASTVVAEAPTVTKEAAVIPTQPSPPDEEASPENLSEMPSSPDTSSHGSSYPGQPPSAPPPASKGSYTEALQQHPDNLKLASFVILLSSLSFVAYFFWKRRRSTPVDTEKGQYTKLAED